MDACWAEILRCAEAGEPVARATVVEARGSTPRETGATMIVLGSGAIAGSVGGGAGEARVVEAAARALDAGTPLLYDVDLTGRSDDSDLTPCGGVMKVFVDCLHWTRPVAAGLRDLEVVGEIHEALRGGRAVALAVVVANPRGTAGIPVGAKWVVGDDARVRGASPPGLDAALGDVVASALEAGRGRRLCLAEREERWSPAPAGEGIEVFVEVIAPGPELIVVGAGHIALPLVRMAKLLDFRVTVVDDREALASPQRFPDADRVIVGRVEDVLRGMTIGPATHVVLVTPSHRHDAAALEAVIRSDAAYLGMIGSRRKMLEVYRHVVAAGVPEELLARVRTPIGLPIGAETPAEIAVAIVAELVQVRRGAPAPAGARPVGARTASGDGGASSAADALAGSSS